MIVDVKVPVLAESVAEATLLGWQKQPGDVVGRGDNLIEIETDKVVLEIPAPANGVLKTLEKREGGEAIRERVTVRIPDDAPTGNYAVKVTAGDFVADNAPEPRDLADLPSYYESYYDAQHLFVVLPTSRVDVDIDGRLLRGLPVSSLPRLARSPGGQKLKLKPVMKFVKRKVPYVVAGSSTLMLRVVR